MKTSLIKHILCCLTIVLSSCQNFLEEDLRGKVIGDAVLHSQSGLESALTGAYKGLGQTWTMGFIHGPQAHITFGGDDRTGPASQDAAREFDTFTVTAPNQILREVYRGCYKTIQGANNVIENYRFTTGDPNQINIIAGEAYFLRAFSYFWLVRLFGELPLITTPEFSMDLLTIEKTDVNTIYDLIVDDLIQSEKLLQNDRRDPGRPNVGTVKAYLAEVYLTMAGWPIKDESKYALASIKAKEVIDNKLLYGFELIPTFTELFANDDTKGTHAESVFAITTNTAGSGSYNSMYGRREMPGEMGGWDACYAEINFFLKFPAGPRKDVTFATEYTLSDGRVVGYDQLATKHPFYKKFWINAGDLNSIAERSSLPVYMMRYAHVLTIYAEAKARTGIIDELSYKCLNDIRIRAGLPELTENLSPDDFALTVVQEKAWEFAGESTRWFDLIRLEMVKEANSDRHPLEPVINSPMDESVYTFPIPNIDSGINPNL